MSDTEENLSPKAKPEPEPEPQPEPISRLDKAIEDLKYRRIVPH